MQSPVNPKARFQDREAFARHLIEERRRAQSVLELFPRPLYELLSDAESEVLSGPVYAREPEALLTQFRERVLTLAEKDRADVTAAKESIDNIDKALLEHFPGRTEIAGYEISVQAKHTYPLGKGTDWVRAQREQNPEVVENYFRFDPAEKAAVKLDMERMGLGQIDPKSAEGQFLTGLSQYRKPKFNGIEVKIKERGNE